MKQLTLILLSLSLISIAYAQQLPFVVYGKIDHASNFKYAYIFNNERKLIDQTEIKDGCFKIKNLYSLDQRFGELPIGHVVLSERVGNSYDSLAIRTKTNVCKFIMEQKDKIEITYFGDDKAFKLSGGVMNELQNKFLTLENSRRLKEESSSRLIEKSKLDSLDQGKQKRASRQKYYVQYQEALIRLIRENYSSPVSLANFLPILYGQYPSAMITEQVFSNFSDELKRSAYGIHIFKDVKNKVYLASKSKRSGLEPGDKMPNFELEDASNTIIKSEILMGKITLIDFWASWCGPCRDESPNLINAYQKYHGTGFNIISVSIDKIQDKQKWIAAIKQDKIQKFSHLIDPNAETGIAKKLKITAIPTNYLIDVDGKVLAVNLRGDDLMSYLNNFYKTK